MSGLAGHGLSAAYTGSFAEHPLYLNHASYGPPSRAVQARVAGLLEQAAGGGPSAPLHAEDERAKAAIGRLTGRPAEQVALTTSTSQGLMQTAFGLSGTVLVSLDEFPANVYPWLRAQDAGRLRVLPLPGSGAEAGAGSGGRSAGGVTPAPVTPERVADALTPGVTALAVSAVDFRTGYRADLDALREVLGPDRLLVVDGIQGFGAVDGGSAAWAAADVLVVGAQKWMRGGWGAGFVALSAAGLDRVAPALGGWSGVDDPARYDGRRHPPRADAARYSITSLSPFATGALATAAELLEAAGPAAVAAAVAERAALLSQIVREAGFDLLSPDVPARRGGIVVAGGSPERVGPALARLAAGGATVTAHGDDRIRFSPHATTPLESLHRAGELLAG